MPLEGNSFETGWNDHGGSLYDTVSQKSTGQLRREHKYLEDNSINRPMGVFASWLEQRANQMSVFLSSMRRIPANMHFSPCCHLPRYISKAVAASFIHPFSKQDASPKDQPATREQVLLNKYPCSRQSGHGIVGIRLSDFLVGQVSLHHALL